MKQEQIEKKLLDLIERAEYTGRQDGISRATRSQKRSDAAREMADISGKLARRMATELAEELAS